MSTTPDPVADLLTATRDATALKAARALLAAFDPAGARERELRGAVFLALASLEAAVWAREDAAMKAADALTGRAR